MTRPDVLSSINIHLLHFHPSGWLRASALTCRLIPLVGFSSDLPRLQSALAASGLEE